MVEVALGLRDRLRVDSRRQPTSRGAGARFHPRRDPRIAGRVTIRLDLLVPCTTKLQRTADGARWQIDEASVW